MKPFIPLLSLVLLTLAACSSPKTITGEVNFVASPEVGTLQLSAAGYGRTKKEAIENAERNAFYNLLFKGIPGSQYNLPLVPEPATAQKTHKKYFNQLLEEGRYKQFMMGSDLQTGFAPIRRGSENAKNLVKIDVTGLRRDLESNQIIRKFGY
jgi:hypothetical protein